MEVDVNIVDIVAKILSTSFIFLSNTISRPRPRRLHFLVKLIFSLVSNTPAQLRYIILSSGKSVQNSKIHLNMGYKC